MPAPVFKIANVVTVTPTGQVTMNDKSEGTSTEFWEGMGKLMAYCTQLEAQLLALQAQVIALEARVP